MKLASYAKIVEPGNLLGRDVCATFDVVIIVPHPPKADMAKAVLSSPPKMRQSGPKWLISRDTSARSSSVFFNPTKFGQLSAIASNVPALIDTAARPGM